MVQDGETQSILVLGRDTSLLPCTSGCVDVGGESRSKEDEHVRVEGSVVAGKESILRKAGEGALEFKNDRENGRA